MTIEADLLKDGRGAGPAPARPGLAAEGYTNAYVWLALALLTLVAMLNTADRIVIGVLAEPIRHDLGLSDGQFGLLAGLFYAVTYTGFALPVAHLAERRGRNLVLGLCVGLWSLATAASGLAVSFLTMAFARIGVAAGEAASTPIIHSLVGEYVSVRFRSRALACIGAGTAFGGVLGYLVGGLLGETYGWRSTFLMVGLPGLVIGLLTAGFLKEPRKGAGTAVADSEVPPLLTTLRTLFREPIYLVLVLVSVLCVMGATSTGTWAAAYLMRAYHVSVGTAGAWLGVTSIASIAGMVLGGYLSVRAADGKGGLRIPAVVVVLGGLASVVAFLSHSWAVTIAGLALGSLCTSVWYAPVFTAVQSVVKGAERGQAVAIMLIFNSALGAGLGPSLVGFLSDWLPSEAAGANLRLPLVGMGVVVILGGLLIGVADFIRSRGARPPSA